MVTRTGNQNSEDICVTSGNLGKYKQLKFDGSITHTGRSRVSPSFWIEV
jgi:hypothetical protein